MAGLWVKKSIAFGLGTLLILAAVPIDAFCICNDSTSQCCREKPIAAKWHACNELSPGETVSSQPNHGCSSDSIPCDSVSSASTCKHLWDLTVLVSATMPIVRNVDEPDFSKVTGGAVLPISEQDFTVLPGLLVSESPQHVFHQAPAYLLFSSLII